MSKIFIHKYIIEPVSRTFYFGGLVHLDSGGEGYTNIFPSPSTLAGMIRGALLGVTDSSDPGKLSDQLFGKKDSFYYDFSWRLIGPYLAKYENGSYEIYYPTPIILRFKEKNDQYIFDMPNISEMEVLKEIDEAIGGVKYPLQSLSVPNFRLGEDSDLESLNFSNGFIASDELRKILSGEKMIQVPKDKYIPANKLEDRGVLKIERIIGIKIENIFKRLQIEDGRGMMYVISRVKLAPNWRYFFAVASRDKELLDKIDNAILNKILRLGGKNSFSIISRIDDIMTIEEELLKKNELPQEFILYFTSPAVLFDGKFDVNNLVSIINSVKQTANLKLISLLTKRIVISGWNMVNTRMREAHIGVDVGSSYILQLNKANLTYSDFLFNRFFVYEKYRGAYGSCLIGKI